MVDIWSPAYRPEKARARVLALHDVPQSRSALFLPGAACRCIQTALDYKVISRRSQLVAVERDPVTAAKMIRKLRQLHVRAWVYPMALHNVTLERPLDLAFCDLNGSLDQMTAGWIKSHLSPHLLPNATVIITLACSVRNNHYMPFVHQQLANGAMEHVHAVADGSLPSDDDTLLTVALFRDLFAPWTFKTDFRLKYQDVGSVPMTLYRFYEFQPRARPSLAALLHPPAKRSVALRGRTVDPLSKAAAALKALRSAAAKRAWVTRRANAAAAKKKRTRRK